MFSKDDIPQEIVDELKQHYSTIDWRYFGMSSTRLQSLSSGIGMENIFEKMNMCVLDYIEITDDKIRFRNYTDPITFKTKKIKGRAGIQYIVRAIFNNTQSIVYPWTIISTGPIIVPPESGDN